MTPGAYLAKRRAASGWSQHDIEVACGMAPGRMAELEAGTTSPDHADVRMLRGYIALNPTMLRGLAAGLPMVLCRECACSEYDACVGGCDRTTGGLCSSCARQAGMAVSAVTLAVAEGLNVRNAAGERHAQFELFNQDWMTA